MNKTLFEAWWEEHRPHDRPIDKGLAQAAFNEGVDRSFELFQTFQDDGECLQLKDILINRYYEIEKLHAEREKLIIACELAMLDLEYLSNVSQGYEKCKIILEEINNE